jgi:ABC-type nitrate/sulfonate/bicarbonate transport system substrate-binding protein
MVVRKNILLLTLLLGLAIHCAFAGGMASADDTKPVIRLAYSRVIDDLPFFVGIEERFFEKEGVRVELVRLTGATNTLAAVVRDDLQAAVISSVQVFPAAQQSLPIKVVSWLGRAHSGTHCGLHVRKNGDIHSLQDLRGKKIAMSNDNMSRMIISEALSKKGMKISDVEIILGIGSDDPMQHEAVLKSGRVDVIIA